MKMIGKFLLAAGLLLSALVPSRAQFMDQQTYSATVTGADGNDVELDIPNYDSFIPGVPLRFVPIANNTGATTVQVNTNPTAVPLLKPTSTGARALVGGELRTGQAVTVMYDGSNFILLSGQYALNPTQQYLKTGTSATYTTPAGATRIVVTMVAGGGGGGGDSGNGGSGGATSFNGITANGGGGGGARSSSSSSGGTPGGGGSNGTGSVALRLNGSAGGASAKGGSVGTQGGTGGAGLYGMGAGASTGAVATSASAGGANTGGGGGGPGAGSDSVTGGGGGGAGSLAIFTITAPTSTYTYTVGAAGTAGTGSPAGGAGGTGLIIVDEYYN